MRILSTLLAAALVTGASLALTAPAHASAKGNAHASAKGAALFTKNGCVACHGLGAKDPKKMGPNFSEVAKKYSKKDVAKLAKKIRAGGKGSFGQMPMPPMPQVSEADAKALAEYALSIK
ncbi:MAG: c-type cytochrome [Candidatus Sericytochromatia bacterium]|nr:c-type cytochrome [Candidatus Sericytochromatia bacterium]